MAKEILNSTIWNEKDIDQTLQEFALWREAQEELRYTPQLVKVIKSGDYRLSIKPRSIHGFSVSFGKSEKDEPFTIQLLLCDPLSLGEFNPLMIIVNSSSDEEFQSQKGSDLLWMSLFRLCDGTYRAQHGGSLLPKGKPLCFKPKKIPSIIRLIQKRDLYHSRMIKNSAEREYQQKKLDSIQSKVNFLQSRIDKDQKNLEEVNQKIQKSLAKISNFEEKE